jgi:2-keto-4-pentenoate hydratase/2-oxohepta-3-ene-1,7-dioic acid hydratase in catechol pathway
MTLWARIIHDGREAFGTVDGETVLLHEGDMFAEAKPTGKSIPLSSVRLLTPTIPSKMVALVDNYRALYFLKANNSFLAGGETIRAPKSYTGKVIYEGELGIVIGKRCSAVSEADATSFIFGYTCINDVTAIDIFSKDPGFAQWTRAKGFDTFGAFGPVIATDVDPAALVVRTILNGQERQNYPLGDIIFAPGKLVSLISQDMTLEAGDVIACGTSIGVGSMKPGSTVSIVIDGIGTLTNQYDS